MHCTDDSISWGASYAINTCSAGRAHVSVVGLVPVDGLIMLFLIVIAGVARHDDGSRTAYALQANAHTGSACLSTIEDSWQRRKSGKYESPNTKGSSSAQG
jgi:hypothetical protein